MLICEFTSMRKNDKFSALLRETAFVIPCQKKYGSKFSSQSGFMFLQFIVLDYVFNMHVIKMDTSIFNLSAHIVFCYLYLFPYFISPY